MDPNSYVFSAFTDRPPSYYTPTMDCFDSLYHPGAGDLLTPEMGMQQPLSTPHYVHSLHTQDPLMNLQRFNHYPLHHPPPPFYDPFHSQLPEIHVPTQQLQTLAPQLFLQHQDSEYVAMDDTPHKMTPTQAELDVGQQTINQPIQQTLSGTISMASLRIGEKFRFHTTLNAPTALVQHADEMPITYLKKGQAYTISIRDTTPPIPQTTPVKYRVYVSVSFEDEQQRARPEACWQLWKEGRGSNEVHQRSGRLPAVEYVDPNQGDDDELGKSQITMQTSSFDGFAVTWFPDPVSCGLDCSISIRFNFLSTDFNRAKGVTGMPVRLCVKTELVTPDTTVSNQPEVCYSKVKLFRDHGAERKLSNDVARVKNMIDKLKQQIAQAKAGLGPTGKRRRRIGSMAKAATSSRRKVMNHKGIWSVDSDANGTKLSVEEDLQMRLVSMQDMFLSTRPVSVLFLRGDLEDDPDLYPVRLPGDTPERKVTVRTTSWESRQSGSTSPTSHTGPPTSSSASQIRRKRKFSEVQQSAKSTKTEAVSVVNPDHFAVDVCSTYQPPQERLLRPVVCFYVRQKNAVKEHYRAIYLMQRTVKDLINGISAKFQIDPHRVAQVTYVCRGFHAIVNEDIVRVLPEGQDMIVEFTPLETDAP